MSKWEEAVVSFVKRHYSIILVFVGIIASVVVRKQGMGFVSDDFVVYLQPWYDTLKENMGFKGLCMDFYEYYIPYMCILAIATYFENLNLLAYIKIISISFEFACALFGGLICLKIAKGNDRRWAAPLFVLLLLSPMIVLNGAFWGQCDYIYIAFLLASILALYSEKYNLSFILFGIAFCFKMQTIFLLPVYLLFYLQNKKFSIFQFLWIPLCYLVGGLPAIIEGKPVKEVYNIYFKQTNLYGQLSMNTPNIWRFFPNMEYDDFYKWGICLTMIIFMMLGFIVFKNNYQLSQKTFLLVSVCSAGICVMFLPGMHERYTALYCILAYIYFMIYDRKKVLLAVIADLITCMTYFLYLYGLEILNYYPLLAVVNLGILCYIIYYTLQTLRQEERN